MSEALKHFGYRLPWEESDWNDISRLVLTWPFLSAFQKVTSENQIKNYWGRSEIFLWAWVHHDCYSAEPIDFTFHIA